MKAPSPFSALPPVISNAEASPKAISRRTSYIQIRLEFLRYPQVITDYFNRRVFGPPQCVTTASSCSWIDHLVSGLRYATFAIFRLAFASAPWLNHLTSLHHVTRRPILQKVRGRAYKIALPLLVNIRFQVLFHSPPGVLFTVPSRYYSLSVTRSYLALGDGPPTFTPDFSCPVLLWIPTCSFQFRIRDYYPVLSSFPAMFSYRFESIIGS